MAALEDGSRVEDADPTHADRMNVLGMSDRGVLFVVVVERGERDRIISARKATSPEIQTYTER